MGQTRLTKAEKASARENAIAALRQHIRPGARICTTLTGVTRGGKTHRIGVFAIIRDYDRGNRFVKTRVPQLKNISSHVSAILGYRFHDSDAVLVHGTGVDKGHLVAYLLMAALYPKGAKLRNAEEAKRAGCEDGVMYPLQMTNHTWL